MVRTLSTEPKKYVVSRSTVGAGIGAMRKAASRGWLTTVQPPLLPPVHCAHLVLEIIVHTHENHDLPREPKLATKHTSSLSSSSLEASSSAHTPWSCDGVEGEAE